MSMEVNSPSPPLCRHGGGETRCGTDSTASNCGGLSGPGDGGVRGDCISLSSRALAKDLDNTK